jgi:curved DNA-binding protein CbpA
MTTFYDLLNVNLNESNENIKMSYRNKIRKYKYKKLNDDDILEIKQLKTAQFILLNHDLREIYNNLITSKEDNTKNLSEDNTKNLLEDNTKNLSEDNNWKIGSLNSYDNTDLNSLFENNIINNSEIKNTKTKSSSLEKVNNFMNDRIFNNIIQTHNNQNKIIYNSIIPIQTREDRKLNN